MEILMKFKLSSLLFSTMLATSIASASNVKMSDAYNGLIPEDVKQDPVRFKAYQEEAFAEFVKKEEKLHTFYDQVERFYAPFTRKGGALERAMANVVCDFAWERKKHAEFKRMLFEAAKGEDINLFGQGMKDRPTKIGQHIALIRRVQDIASQVTEIKSQIKNQPNQRRDWENEIVSKQQNITQHTEKLTHLQKQEVENEEAIRMKQKAEGEIQDKFTEAMHELCALDNELTKLEEEYQARKVSTEQAYKTDESELKQIEEDVNSTSSTEVQNKQISEPFSEEGSEYSAQAKLEKALKELEDQYNATQKPLSEKKAEITAQIEHLEKEKLKMIAEIEALEQENKAFKEEIIKMQGAIEQEKAAIHSLSQNIEAQAEEQKRLEKESLRLTVEQQDLQDQADMYALIKYLTFLNLYSALPNDDFDYHGYETSLTTLSFDALPTILRLINKRADQVGRENVRLALDREMSKFQETVDVYIENLETSLLEDNIATAAKQGNLGYNDDTRKRIATIAGEKFRALTPGEGVVAKYKESTDKYYYYPLPINGIKFSTDYSSELDSLRADHQIKASMIKWRSKISTEKGSLVQRLGLESALFNPDFSIKNYPELLSFSGLEFSLKGTKLMPYPESLKDRKIWSLGMMQLKLNFFVDLAKENEAIRKRVMPIFHFVDSKVNGVSALSKTTERKIGFKELFTQDQGKAVHHAYLKYISYMNMLYALLHDGTGKKMPELKMIDPIVEDLLSKPLPLEMRLDNVMAAKAHKWGSRVVEHGGKFITENGLEAHTFMPLFEDKAE